MSESLMFFTDKLTTVFFVFFLPNAQNASLLVLLTVPPAPLSVVCFSVFRQSIQIQYPFKPERFHPPPPITVNYFIMFTAARD